ncbi:MAG: 4Fe-4S dicluster domain-containing protein [Bacillota bacterium]|nr:4Fe-4S dicluster domain-containing protein [Bacillota bacterium]
MSDKKMLLVDLEKCVGCYACEVGCQQWHGESEVNKRVRVKLIGPSFYEGKPVRDFVPIFTERCDLCASENTNIPFCVSHCPVNAIYCYQEDDALGCLHGPGRVQIGKISE